MYINDTHIGFYIAAAIIGLLMGQVADWVAKRLPENKKIISRDIIRACRVQFRPNYILMLITSAIYVGLVYMFGIQNYLIGNLELIKYALLTPMLLSAFVIDWKSKIIPNRLNLTMFEVGIIIAFLYGLSDVAITINMVLGMIVGGGIFLLITLIGGAIYGKEAMGFGDVKLMGALGLYFGWVYIIMISVMAFLFAAIVSIGILIFKRKKVDEYIPFGPFIVTSSIICIYVPFYILFTTLLKVFSLGMI